MTGPDGKQMTPFGGEYLEIIPDLLISYSNTFELPEAETMIMTHSFIEQANRTRLVMTTVFASVAMKDQHLAIGFRDGVGGGLDQLADVVAGLAS